MRKDISRGNNNQAEVDEGLYTIVAQHDHQIIVDEELSMTPTQIEELIIKNRKKPAGVEKNNTTSTIPVVEKVAKTADQIQEAIESNIKNSTPLKKHKNSDSDLDFLKQSKYYNPKLIEKFRTLSDDNLRFLEKEIQQNPLLVSFIQKLGSKKINIIGLDLIQKILKKHKNSDSAIKRICLVMKNGVAYNIKKITLLASRISSEDFIKIYDEIVDNKKREFNKINYVMTAYIEKIWSNKRELTTKQLESIIGIWKQDYKKFQEICGYFNQPELLKGFLDICNSSGRRTKTIIKYLQKMNSYDIEDKLREGKIPIKYGL